MWPASSGAATISTTSSTGLVVKVDDLSLQARLGVDAKGAPLGDRLQVPARGADHEAARH